MQRHVVVAIDQSGSMANSVVYSSIFGAVMASLPAVIAAGLFLGLSATFYTLYTGLFAMTACLMAAYLIVMAWRGASNKAVATDVGVALR